MLWLDVDVVHDPHTLAAMLAARKDMIIPNCVWFDPSEQRNKSYDLNTWRRGAHAQTINTIGGDLYLEGHNTSRLPYTLDMSAYPCMPRIYPVFSQPLDRSCHEIIAARASAARARSLL